MKPLVPAKPGTLMGAHMTCGGLEVDFDASVAARLDGTGDSIRVGADAALGATDVVLDTSSSLFAGRFVGRI
jgi:hypothetical protein